jgi:hypothetical protein
MKPLGETVHFRDLTSVFADRGYTSSPPGSAMLARNLLRRSALMTKVLLLAGLLILISMAFVGPQIASKLGSLSAPDPTTDADTPPRRYAHRAYVEFQTAQGPRVGYVEDFFWSEQFQNWSYDIQTTNGVVFENVVQKDIIGLQEEEQQ